MVNFEPLPCAGCAQPLEPQTTEQGTVWICRACVAGAATLGVIRKVAPREFINHIWQAARAFGRESELPCPSCTQPLLTFHPDEVSVSPKLEICCRCFFLWLDREALASLGLTQRGRSPLREAAARLQAHALASGAPREMQGQDAVLLALAAVSDVAELLGATLGAAAYLPDENRR